MKTHVNERKLKERRMSECEVLTGRRETIKDGGIKDRRWNLKEELTDVSLQDKVAVRLNTRKVNVLQNLFKELCVRKGTDDAHDLGDKDLGHGRIGGFHLSFEERFAKLGTLLDRSKA